MKPATNCWSRWPGASKSVSGPKTRRADRHHHPHRAAGAPGGLPSDEGVANSFSRQPKSVTLDGKSTTYDEVDTTRGLEVHAKTSTGTSHTLTVTTGQTCAAVRRGVPTRAPCIRTTPHVNTELVVATEELPEKFSLLLGASSS